MNKLKGTTNYETVCFMSKSEKDIESLLKRFPKLAKLNPECVIEGELPSNPNISVLFYQTGVNPNYLLFAAGYHIRATREITGKKNMTIVTGKVKKLLKG